MIRAAPPTAVTAASWSGARSAVLTFVSNGRSEPCSTAMRCTTRAPPIGSEKRSGPPSSQHGVPSARVTSAPSAARCAEARRARSASGHGAPAPVASTLLDHTRWWSSSRSSSPRGPTWCSGRSSRWCGGSRNGTCSSTTNRSRARHALRRGARRRRRARRASPRRRRPARRRPTAPGRRRPADTTSPRPSSSGPAHRAGSASAADAGGGDAVGSAPRVGRRQCRPSAPAAARGGLAADGAAPASAPSTPAPGRGGRASHRSRRTRSARRRSIPWVSLLASTSCVTARMRAVT